MAGPPTPPAEPSALPGPAISVAPAAPENATPATATAPPPASVAPANSPYPALFPAIADACARADFAQVAKLAETDDVHISSDRDEHRLLITAPLVLANLILDDIPPAQFALFRLPNPLSDLPLSQALFSLTASVSERRHAHVYSRATELRALVSAPEFSESVVFSQTLTALTDAFLEAFRTRVFALVARAYTSIPVQLAQTYLGLPQEQVLSIAQTHNWTYDSTSQILTPAPQSTAAGAFSVTSAPSTLAAFERITDNVAALEA
ncbi:hypothetical protein PENSPDRAFT_614109 [Peniophora sp. CONT]|nr:hypothetical protein PENSPDRAFT_614109 [Peniophora sp. CONT]